MGGQVSSPRVKEHEAQPLAPRIVDSSHVSRTRSCMVSILSENLRVQSDLTLSLHQLAELGNTEALECKLQNGEDVNQLDGNQLAPLHYAAHYNHLPVASLLLQHNAEVNVCGQDNRTPLHYAARCRTKLQNATSGTQLVVVEAPPDVAKGVMEGEGEGDSMVVLLHNNHAIVNAQDKYGQTPLHFAAMTGNIAAATELVEYCNADVEVEDNQQTTPLIMAATQGYVDIARLLLESASANLRQADSSRQTALHRAVKSGHLRMVNLLLHKGRDMKNYMSFLNARDTKRKTALYHACSNGHVLVAAVLLEEQADAEAETVALATSLHAAASVGNVDIIGVLLEHKVQLDEPDLYQRTPLMYAAAGNNNKAIQLLAQRGANLEHKDLNQSTALLLAAHGGHAAAVQMLLELGADVQATDKLNKTAVYISAEQGKVETVKVLLEVEESRKLLDVVDYNGSPPVHIAVAAGNMAVVELLLKAGASIHLKNEEQDTVLHLAARRGYTMMVMELIPQCHKLMNSENEDLDTPLHLACRRGHEGVIKVLLEVGADLSTTNSSSSTPLHLAAAQGYTKCCLLLLDSDAPKDLHNKDHKTPLMEAVVAGHVGVTRLLLERGASLAARDNANRNSLQLAILAGQRDTAMAIIQSAMWETALRHVSQDLHGRRLTPFRMLIERLPGVAEVVLHRCIKKINRMTTNDDNDDIQDRVMNFEYLDDTYQVRAGGSQFDQVGRLKPRASPYTKHARVLKHNHPLMLMVQYRQSSLLAHPVCVNLIKHKWVSYGRFVYYGNLGLYLVFLLSFTAYVLAVRELNWVGVNVTRAGEDDVRDAVHCEEVDWDEWHGTSFLWVTKWLVLVMAALQMLKEFAQLCQACVGYFNSENLVELVCYLCAVLFVINFNGCSIKEEWQWQTGAMAIFLAWMNLLLFIRVFPFFGIYVIMFTEILSTFSSFFLVFFFFIIAFALSFYTVLGEQYPFRTPAHSLLRTAVMMIGEIDYQDVFSNPENPIEYPEVTYILVMAFMVFMSILIMNLLVGLAVHDIKSVQEQAMLQKLAMQTKLVVEIEMVIPEYIRRRYVVRNLKVVEENKTNILRWLFAKFSFYQEKELSDVDNLRQEVLQLKSSVDDLLDIKASLQDLGEVKDSLRILSDLRSSKTDLVQLKNLVKEIHKKLGS